MVRLQGLVIASMLLLLVATAPAQAASGESGIHYARMVVEPDGPDFEVTIYYNAGFMTKVFSMLFGTGSLIAAIEDEISDFGEVDLQSLDTTDCVAKFTISNQSVYAEGWYMYDNNARFAVPVDQLEIRGGTLDRPIIISNATEMPDFFYQ